MSDLVTDQKQKSDLNFVDNTLTQVSGVVVGIIEKGQITNVEIKRQIEQMEGMEVKVDTAVGRIQNLNVRMDKAT